LPVSAPARICFFIPIVISKPLFLENSRLSAMGREMKLIYTRYSLIAEFEHAGFGGEIKVILLTPEPVEASPGKGARRVGIGVEVEDGRLIQGPIVSN